MNLLQSLDVFIHLAALVEACDLLGHRFADGFLEFVHRLLHIRRFLLIRVRFKKMRV